MQAKRYASPNAVDDAQEIISRDRCVARIAESASPEDHDHASHICLGQRSGFQLYTDSLSGVWVLWHLNVSSHAESMPTRVVVGFRDRR